MENALAGMHRERVRQYLEKRNYNQQMFLSEANKKDRIIYLKLVKEFDKQAKRNASLYAKQLEQLSLSLNT